MRPGCLQVQTIVLRSLASMLDGHTATHLHDSMNRPAHDRLQT
jgi:hypothetical protein